MGCVGQNVVCAGLFPLFDGADFSTYSDEGVAETVQFAERFGFSGFDHQGVGDGPGHCGGVESNTLEEGEGGRGYPKSWRRFAMSMASMPAESLNSRASRMNSWAHMPFLLVYKIL
jgi:hypothetical protein